MKLRINLVDVGNPEEQKDVVCGIAYGQLISALQ